MPASLKWLKWSGWKLAGSPTIYRQQPKLPIFLYSSNRLFGGGAADAGNATPTFCFSVPAISKPTTLTVMDCADQNTSSWRLMKRAYNKWLKSFFISSNTCISYIARWNDRDPHPLDYSRNIASDLRRRRTQSSPKLRIVFGETYPPVSSRPTSTLTVSSIRRDAIMVGVIAGVHWLLGFPQGVSHTPDASPSSVKCLWGKTHDS